MFGSLSTALSALSAHSAAIDVVGNNLANLNTTGFKQNTVSFFEMMNAEGFSGLGTSQTGFGVGRPSTLREFVQGSLQTTSGPLDAAIQGDGFLVVKNLVPQEDIAELRQHTEDLMQGKLPEQNVEMNRPATLELEPARPRDALSPAIPPATKARAIHEREPDPEALVGLLGMDSRVREGERAEPLPGPAP